MLACAMLWVSIFGYLSCTPGPTRGLVPISVSSSGSTNQESITAFHSPIYYISATGKDVNNCTSLLPCRSLDAALALTQHANYENYDLMDGGEDYSVGHHTLSDMNIIIIYPSAMVDHYTEHAHSSIDYDLFPTIKPESVSHYPVLTLRSSSIFITAVNIRYSAHELSPSFIHSTNDCSSIVITQSRIDASQVGVFTNAFLDISVTGWCMLESVLVTNLHTRSQHGGFINLHGNPDSVYYLESCTFLNVSAAGYGGALALTLNPDSRYSLSSLTFTNCTSTYGHGGAMAITVDDSTDMEGAASDCIEYKDLRFSENEARFGRNIFVRSPSLNASYLPTKYALPDWQEMTSEDLIISTTHTIRSFISDIRDSTTNTAVLFCDPKFFGSFDNSCKTHHTPCITLDKMQEQTASFGPEIRTTEYVLLRSYDLSEDFSVEPLIPTLTQVIYRKSHLTPTHDISIVMNDASLIINHPTVFDCLNFEINIAGTSTFAIQAYSDVDIHHATISPSSGYQSPTINFLHIHDSASDVSLTECTFQSFTTSDAMIYARAHVKLSLEAVSFDSINVDTGAIIMIDDPADNEELSFISILDLTITNITITEGMSAFSFGPNSMELEDVIAKDIKFKAFTETNQEFDETCLFNFMEVRIGSSEISFLSSSISGKDPEVVFIRAELVGLPGISEEMKAKPCVSLNDVVLDIQDLSTYIILYFDDIVSNAGDFEWVLDTWTIIDELKSTPDTFIFFDDGGTDYPMKDILYTPLCDKDVPYDGALCLSEVIDPNKPCQDILTTGTSAVLRKKATILQNHIVYVNDPDKRLSVLVPLTVNETGCFEVSGYLSVNTISIDVKDLQQTLFTVNAVTSDDPEFESYLRLTDVQITSSTTNPIQQILFELKKGAILELSAEISKIVTSKNLIHMPDQASLALPLSFIHDISSACSLINATNPTKITSTGTRFYDIYTESGSVFELVDLAIDVHFLSTFFQYIYGSDSACISQKGLAQHGSTISCDSLVVSHCQATTGNGGAFSLHANTSLNMMEVTMEACTAPNGLGGGFYIDARDYATANYVVQFEEVSRCASQCGDIMFINMGSGNDVLNVSRITLLQFNKYITEEAFQYASNSRKYSFRHKFEDPLLDPTLHVSSSGVDTETCGTYSSPCKTITGLSKLAATISTKQTLYFRTNYTLDTSVTIGPGTETGTTTTKFPLSIEQSVYTSLPLTVTVSDGSITFQASDTYPYSLANLRLHFKSLNKAFLTTKNEQARITNCTFTSESDIAVADSLISSEAGTLTMKNCTFSTFNFTKTAFSLIADTTITQSQFSQITALRCNLFQIGNATTPSKPKVVLQGNFRNISTNGGSIISASAFTSFEIGAGSRFMNISSTLASPITATINDSSTFTVNHGSMFFNSTCVAADGGVFNLAVNGGTTLFSRNTFVNCKAITKSEEEDNLNSGIVPTFRNDDDDDEDDDDDDDDEIVTQARGGFLFVDVSKKPSNFRLDDCFNVNTSAKYGQALYIKHTTNTTEGFDIQLAIKPYSSKKKSDIILQVGETMSDWTAQVFFLNETVYVSNVGEDLLTCGSMKDPCSSIDFGMLHLKDETAAPSYLLITESVVIRRPHVFTTDTLTIKPVDGSSGTLVVDQYAYRRQYFDALLTFEKAVMFTQLTFDNPADLSGSHHLLYGKSAMTFESCNFYSHNSITYNIIYATDTLNMTSCYFTRLPDIHNVHQFVDSSYFQGVVTDGCSLVNISHCVFDSSTQRRIRPIPRDMPAVTANALPLNEDPVCYIVPTQLTIRSAKQATLTQNYFMNAKGGALLIDSSEVTMTKNNFYNNSAQDSRFPDLEFNIKCSGNSHVNFDEVNSVEQGKENLFYFFDPLCLHEGVFTERDSLAFVPKEPEIESTTTAYGEVYTLTGSNLFPCGLSFILSPVYGSFYQPIYVQSLGSSNQTCIKWLIPKSYLALASGFWVEIEYGEKKIRLYKQWIDGTYTSGLETKSVVVIILTAMLTAIAIVAGLIYVLIIKMNERKQPPSTIRAETEMGEEQQQGFPDELTQSEFRSPEPTTHEQQIQPAVPAEIPTETAETYSDTAENPIASDNTTEEM
ncbi:hypothetical protein BLNAU_18153 [Blattamonas nauphoetae]|uniref:Uncharacterized protein n=1 Tax=Blattamonas nauphoetae TaxID=2049346 RepID=A0ABQ9X6I6_9EUKA|nr:hypothetical protein BLNAU_18153 [Blattamonas nauphoetae]